MKQGIQGSLWMFRYKLSPIFRLLGTFCGKCQNVFISIMHKVSIIVTSLPFYFPLRCHENSLPFKLNPANIFSLKTNDHKSWTILFPGEVSVEWFNGIYIHQNQKLPQNQPICVSNSIESYIKQYYNILVMVVFSNIYWS